MDLLEHKLLSLYPESAATLIAVSKDVKQYPHQYPDISTDLQQSKQQSQMVAPSGWGLPNQHYQQKILLLKEHSKDLRYLYLVQYQLELRYVPKRATEPFADIYNMLRTGDLQKAVYTLSSSHLQLHAAMLAGYQSMLGSNAVEIDVAEWIAQAKSFSENTRYPLLERGVFGVLSGNNYPLKDWLAGQKNDYDDAWICCVNGVREGLTGGNPRAYLQQVIYLVSKLQPEHIKLITSNYLGFCQDVAAQFASLNNQYSDDTIGYQRRLALIGTYVLNTFKTVQHQTEAARQTVAILNGVVEQYVRYILKIRNSPDNDLIPLLITNLESQISIQLMLLYLQTNNDLEAAVQLSEECLESDEESILQFKFTALQQLAQEYFELRDERIGRLYVIASYGRFPLPATVQFVFILFVLRFLIEIESYELARQNVKILSDLYDRYYSQIDPFLHEEYLADVYYLYAIQTDFTNQFLEQKNERGYVDNYRLLQSFSELQRNFYAVLQTIKNGVILQDLDNQNAASIEYIFHSSSIHRGTNILHFLRILASRTVIELVHTSFMFATIKEAYKRRELLGRILDIPRILVDTDGQNVRLADFIDSASAAELCMMVQKAYIGMLCQ